MSSASNRGGDDRALANALAEALRQRDDYRDRLESAQREIARLEKGWTRCKRRLERITEPDILRDQEFAAERDPTQGGLPYGL